MWDMSKESTTYLMVELVLREVFPISKNFSEFNQDPESLISRWSVYDYIQKSGGPLNAPISSEMLMYANSSRAKHTDHQDKKRF